MRIEGKDSFLPFSPANLHLLAMRARLRYIIKKKEEEEEKKELEDTREKENERKKKRENINAKAKNDRPKRAY